MSTNSRESIANVADQTWRLPWLSIGLEESAKVWNWSQRAVTMMMLGPVLIAFSGVVAAVMGKDAYKLFTGEDAIAETLQVILYVAAFVLSLVVLKHRIREGNKLMIVLYAFLTCGFFFMIGEELSWGQRIFGWETPATLRETNKQEETNLHNIQGVGSTFKWIQMLVGAYGTILPCALLLARHSKLVVQYRRFLSMLIPHYSLIPYFAVLFVWRIYRIGFEPPTRFYFVVSEYNEVMELSLAMGFVLFLVFQLRVIQSERRPVETDVA